jgi:hypothetical protein
MRQKKQSGSAHLTIIIILVIALVGLLGFVYWQNFMQPKTIEAENNTATNTSNLMADGTVLLSKSITETVTGANLTLSYPNDWILTSSKSLNPDQESLNERIYITSPDTNVKVSLWSGISGVGGTCDPESAGTFSSVKTYPLPVYPGLTLYETMTSNRISSTKVLRSNDAIIVGGSGCETGLGFFSATNKTTNGLGITFENTLSNNSVEGVNSARETDNYKTAVRIVQSLHEQ